MDNLKEIVEKEYKNSSVQSIKKIAEGFNNEVFEVVLQNPKKELILKVVRHTRSLEYFEKEERVINFIRYRLEKFPLPKNVKILSKENEVIIIRDKIKGLSLRTAYKTLTKKERREIFIKVGELKAKLHKIWFKQYGELNGKIKVVRIYKDWYKKRNTQFKECLELMKFDNVISHKFITKQIEFWKDAKHELKTETTPRFCHGDSALSNIIIDTEGKNIKVFFIDYEFAKASGAYEDLLKFSPIDQKEYEENTVFLLKGYKKYGAVPENWKELQIVYKYLLAIKALGKPDRMVKEIQKVKKLNENKLTEINKTAITKLKMRKCENLIKEYYQIKEVPCLF